MPLQRRFIFNEVPFKRDGGSTMKFKALLGAALLCLPHIAQAQIDTRNSCDFDDIKEFVAWFQGSEANQRSATADPLDAAFEEFDDKGNKLEMVYEPHAHDELGWPILPLLGGDFKVTFIEHDADRVEYITAGGMGYNHSYLFKRQPCWTLVKFTHDRL